jgi:hypothetical protein
MPAIPYSQDAVVNRNGGAPNVLSDANPLVVVDSGPGAAKVIALHNPLETAACDNANVVGAWSLLAAGSSQTVGAGTRTAVRRVTLGYVPFGLNWT